MNTEDDEFVICGDGGSAEDAAFDAVVGVIEDFMVSYDMEEVWAKVPVFSAVSSEHDRHSVYRAVLAEAEREMDAYVLARCPAYPSIEAIGTLLQERHDDISEEVWEFVSEGCFDYETFIELWKQQKP